MKKYNCQICNYETNRLSDHKKHLQTKKHKNNLEKSATLQRLRRGEVRTVRGEGRPYRGEFLQKSENSKKSKGFTCEFCEKYFKDRSHKARHYKLCKDKTIHELKLKDKELQRAEQEKLEIQKRAELEKLEMQKKAEQAEREKQELLEQFNNCLLKLWEEQSKPQVVNNIQNIQNINIDSLNITYVKKNFLDAYNYEDLMDPLLTHDEIQLIEESPINGCYELVKSRCIDNIELEKRPIHCVDPARKKYALRTNDEWTLDYNGNKILNGVDKKISWMIKNYDLNLTNHRDKHLKILQGMLSDKYKIMDYLKDDVILKENAKMLTK